VSVVRLESVSVAGLTPVTSAALFSTAVSGAKAAAGDMKKLYPVGGIGVDFAPGCVTVDRSVEAIGLKPLVEWLLILFSACRASHC